MKIIIYLHFKCICKDALIFFRKKPVGRLSKLNIFKNGGVKPKVKIF